MDAVWGGRSDGSWDEIGSWVLGSDHRTTGGGNLRRGAIVRRSIVTKWGVWDVPVRKCVNRQSCGLGGEWGQPKHWCIRWGSKSCKGNSYIMWNVLDLSQIIALDNVKPNINRHSVIICLSLVLKSFIKTGN